MSDTPRTDDESFDVLDANEEYSRDHSYKNDGEYVNSDFARQLERELAAMTAELDRLQVAMNEVSKEPEGRYWQAKYKVSRDALISMTAAKNKAVGVLKSAERNARDSGYPKTADAYAKLIAELEEVK